MEFVKKIKPKAKKVKDNYLFTADALKILKQIPDKSITLVITDPPYNIGLKYNTYNDKKEWSKYYEDLGLVLGEISRILKDDGSLYLINYPEINARTLPFLDKANLNMQRWLTWHYPTNIGHAKKNYTRSQRSILFCTKTNNYIFNKDGIIQPYKNPNVGKIKKLIESGKRGRTPYDTLNMEDLFEIEKLQNSDVININLLKNVSKFRAGSKDKKAKDHHPCQLPLSLIKVFINASSNEGDTVLDCFAGTFTTSAAAKELKRKSIGIELDPEYTKLGLARLGDNGFS